MIMNYEQFCFWLHGYNKASEIKLPADVAENLNVICGEDTENVSRKSVVNTGENKIVLSDSTEMFNYDEMLSNLEEESLTDELPNTETDRVWETVNEIEIPNIKG